MITGRHIYSHGLDFLAQMYEERREELPAQMFLRGVEISPKTSRELAETYVNDTPPEPGTFAEVYIEFAKNLANFQRMGSIVQPALREELARAVINLGQSGTLADAAARLNDEAGLEDGAENNPWRKGFFFLKKHMRELQALQERDLQLSSRKSRVGLFDGKMYQNYLRGLVEGVKWLAEIESRYQGKGMAAWAADETIPKIGQTAAQARWALIERLSSRQGNRTITYMRQAVTANFLKDIGLTKFAKPDVQTTRAADMILALNGKGLGTVNQLEREKLTFFAITDWAVEADVEPRQLDRVLYLIGSGNFHYHVDRPWAGGAQRMKQFVDELAANSLSPAIAELEPA